MARIGNRNFERVDHFSSKGQHPVGNHIDVCGIHLAFIVDDIDAVFAQVKALGAEPTTATELGGYKAFFLRDLNGVQVEIGQVN